MIEGATIYMNSQKNDFLFCPFSEGFGGVYFFTGRAEGF